MTLMCSELRRVLGFSDPRSPVPSRSASLQGKAPRLASVIVNELMLMSHMELLVCIVVGRESSGLLW